jgi:hypothetical protein
MRSATCWLLAMLLAVQAGAVLQVDLPTSTLDEACLGSLQARLFIQGSPRAWPATAILPPSGHPAMWHLIFAYDDELRGRTVDKLELALGAERRSWKPERLEAGYPAGPAFPVTARVKSLGPCLDQAPPDAFQVVTDHAGKAVQFQVLLAKEGPLKLEVLDLLGNPVSNLSRGVKSRGRHSFRLSTAGLPAGLYLVKLEMEGRREVRKLLLS